MSDSPTSQATDEAQGPRRVFRRLDTRGRAIDWRLNLYAIWLAEFLAILGFSLRAPFLPFFLEDLGVGSDASVALWSGLINAGGAGVMAVTAPFWGGCARTRLPGAGLVLNCVFAGG